MTLKRTAIAILATGLACAASFAAPARSASGIKVTASMDSTVLLMGDQSHLYVNVDLPASDAARARMLDFPEIPSGADYISRDGIDFLKADSTSTTAGDRMKIRYDYTIQAFDPGTITIPPFAVHLTGTADTAFSQVLTLKVIPVDVDSLETVHPLQSVVSANNKWYDYFPLWVIWVLAAAALAGAGLWLWKTLRTRKEVIEARREPVLPPYELAVSRLNKLRRQGLAESGHEKEYYTSLVDILRQYLQGRFHINAMEMTSSQIVKALRSNPDTRMTADMMRSVLSIADFVKFAKERPLPDDNVRAFNRACDFLEETKPAPEPESENPAQADNGKK
ncbi:MAG: BatD family protein [Muribaculaceae bacterium]|nr:BatD family protein [Muribaculaceae bacterium]